MISQLKEETSVSEPKFFDNPPNGMSSDEFLTQVFGELQVMARGLLAGEGNAHSIETGDLLNEAIIRVSPAIPTEVSRETQRYFFGAMYQAMSRTLVDRARARGARKRGGDVQRFSLGERDFDRLTDGLHRNISSQEVADILVDAESFREHYPELVELLNLRLLGGLSNTEAAEILGVDPVTVRRWIKKLVILLGRT